MEKPVLAAFLSCSGQTLTDEEKYLFEKTNPAGITLFGRNIKNKQQLKSLTNQIKEVVGRDNFLIAIDQEGGRVRRLKEPDFKFYASQSEIGSLPLPEALEETKRHAQLISSDLKEIGINVNFAPVLDIARPTTTEALRSRCFSSDIKTVSALGKTMVTTYMESGIIPCIKHMPGHGAAEQTLDIGAVRPNHQQRKDDGINDLRNVPLAQERVDQTKGHQRHDREDRNNVRDGNAHGRNRQQDQSQQRIEHQRGAQRGRNALAALELIEDGVHMSQHHRDARQGRARVAEQPKPQQAGQHALEHIAHKRHQRSLRTQHAEHIGRAGGLGAVCANVHMLRAGDDHAGLNAAQQIRHDQDENPFQYRHWALILLFFSCAYPNADRRAFQREGFAKMVFQIALIGEVHQILVVDKEDEGRRLRGLLRRVIDAQAAAVFRRRRRDGHRIVQRVVEHAGGDAAGRIAVSRADGFQHAVDALAGLGRNIEHRRVIQELQVVAHLLGELFHGAGFFVDRVPLVDDDDARLAFVMHITRNARVLLGHAVLRVDEHQRHIAATDRRKGSDNAVTLQRFVLNLALSADACRVDDDEILAVIGKGRVNGIARGARNIGNHHAFLVENAVGQRGFAHIGAADHGDLDRAVVFLAAFIRHGFGQQLAHLLQQVAQSQQVDRGNRMRLAHAQGIELRLVQFAHRGVDLVDHQHHRALGAAKHIRHLIVRSGQAVAPVHEEQDHVRRLDGNFRLAAHLAQQRIVGIGIDTAGIHQREFIILPGCVGIDTVARHAGGILHDGNARPYHFVEKRGFAHVGPPDDGNNRFDRHGLYPPNPFSSASASAAPLFSITWIGTPIFSCTSSSVMSSKKRSCSARSIFSVIISESV